jgi:hypothetical protein
VAQREKTEPLPVCVDADVLIAGLLSRTGASHAILVLGEIGLVRLGLPEAAVEEVRRNLSAKLPEDVPILAAAIGAGARLLVTHSVRTRPFRRRSARRAPTNAHRGGESLDRIVWQMTRRRTCCGDWS